MQIRSASEGSYLILLPSLVVGKAGMQRLMDIGDKVDDVLQRLEPLGIWCRRRQHDSLSFDSANDAVTVGAVASCFIVAVGI